MTDLKARGLLDETLVIWGGEFGRTAFTQSTQGPNVRDLHATLLHCLGIDHERFTVRFQGLDDRLTGVDPARVVTEILARGVDER